MNKKLVILLVLGLVILAWRALAQTISPPAIQWQYTFGGSANEILYSLQQTADHGYILGGRSISVSGPTKPSPSYGSYDFYFVRINETGQKLWEQTYGGSGFDECHSLQQTANGQFIVGGFSESDTNGNKTSPNYGSRDGWVLLLDSNGNKVWEQSHGGSGYDTLTIVQQTSDGGYVLGGSSESGMNGNKTSANRGGRDFWVIRLATNGAKLWEQTFGGTGNDELFGLHQTSDGGFVLAGNSNSGPGGNKTASGFGGTDFWIVRLDAAGNIVWDRCFGGSADDECYSVRQTSDGGFIAGGFSISGPNGNKTSPIYGQYDYWVVRLDADGNKLWDRTFGGYGNEAFMNSFTIRQVSDGGFLMGGTAGDSGNGNKTSPTYGFTDFWIVRINAAGDKLWDQSFGAYDLDVANSLQQTADGGFIIGGPSYSDAGGNKTAPRNGGADFWVIKLEPDLAHLRVSSQSTESVKTNGFHFFVSGEMNHTYVTEYTTNFSEWIPILTNQLSSAEIEVVIPDATNSPLRFYRERLQ